MGHKGRMEKEVISRFYNGVYDHICPNYTCLGRPSEILSPQDQVMDVLSDYTCLLPIEFPSYDQTTFKTLEMMHKPEKDV